MDELKPSQPNSSPLTPLGFLDRAATVYGDCISVVYNTTSYTWSQTHRRCLQLASSLVSLGIKPGHVVSVLAPNIPPMYELHFAVPMSGAVLHTINTHLDARTVSVHLRHSESKLVFVDVLSYLVLQDALKEIVDPPIVVLITDIYVDAPSPAVDHTYERLVEMGDPDFKWFRPKGEWDPMVLNYTSGTTSAPKGVVHCHRGLFITCTVVLIEWFVPKQPVYLWTLPMFHGNGWAFTWGMAAVGGTNICLRKVDVAVIYRLIRAHRVTHMCGAPVVLNMLANAPSDRFKPLNHPVHVLTGGSAPPARVLERVEPMGFIVTHAYGLTETGGTVVFCAWKREWDKLPLTERAKLKARQGVRTVSMEDIDVVDPETGRSVKRDGSTLGEIVLRGGCLMLGYLKDPISTSKCMGRHGWFYTGDVGVMHPDGYLEIKDRSKDVINSGGEKVCCVEVESVLYSHPLIYDAAVVARPDEFWGETPCAFVSLKAKSGRVTEKEIIEYCRERMPHYMVPKSVVFKDLLPTTSTGKIKKFVLRDMAKSLGPLKKSRL